MNHEREIDELNEKHEQKLDSLRLEFDTKIEQLTNEHQMEILTLKQIYQTVFDEKYQLNEQLKHIQFNEQNLQENLDKTQLEYDQLLKLNQKPLRINILTQTVSFIIKQHISSNSFFSFQDIPNQTEQQIETLTKQNIQLVDELSRITEQFKLLQIDSNKREQFYSTEKIQYEERIKEISKHPIMTSIKLQTVNYLI